MIENLITNLNYIGIVDPTPVSWIPTIIPFKDSFRLSSRTDKYIHSNLSDLVDSVPNNLKSLNSVLNHLLHFNSKSYLTSPVAVLLANTISGEVTLSPITVGVDTANSKLLITPSTASPIHLDQLLIWRTSPSTSSLFKVSTRDLRRGWIGFDKMIKKDIAKSILDGTLLSSEKVVDIFTHFTDIKPPKGTVLVSKNWVSKPDNNLIFKIE